MTILGWHHITLVCADAARTVDFYTRILGLRFIKKTVNFDAPDSYHIYFGNYEGAPGSAITFFEWGNAPRGAAGIGGTHHFALQVPDRTALLKWKRWLHDHAVRVDGIYNRKYFESIYFRDPDGCIVELATNTPGFSVDEAPESLGTVHQVPPPELTARHRDAEAIAAELWAEPIEAITPDMALTRGLHHISAICSDIQRTHAYYGELFGLRLVKMTEDFDNLGAPHWYWGVGEGAPGTLITYFERPSGTRRAQIGTGQTHHFAFGLPNAEVQLEWREKLIAAGLSVSPVMERVYFKSIYTRDPDGHIVELATVDPGFAVDEPLESLGSALKLPPWLEPQRAMIERMLPPLP